MDETKRVYAEVTPIIHRRFKVACAMLGTTMRKRLLECVKRTLEEAAEKRKADAAREEG